jgi:hypothetical protein
VEYVELLSFPAATAVPKYRPLPEAAAPNVLPAACADEGAATRAVTTIAAPAEKPVTTVVNLWRRALVLNQDID